jgi:type I restriction enzyme S subunit
MTTDKLPNGWTRVKFRDIAASITERVDDPSSAGVDRYVGLEHLDPDSTLIRRWGSPSEVESTKLRFYPGDVVYGRRRAYQRKLGVADFEGICSAHALVLRARPDVCLVEFLPYFLQSDAFHHRALDISVGSLSPTINWKTLAVQEFALPPIDEQQRIVEVLASIDQSVDAQMMVRAQLEPLKRAVLTSALKGGRSVKALAWGTIATAANVQLLGDLCTITRGSSPRPKGNPAYFARGSTANHWIMISDVTRSKVGKVLTDTAEFLTDEGVTKSRKVSPGSLLLTNCATVGVPVFSGVHGCIHDGFLLFEELSPELDVDYLYRLFEFLTPWFRSSAQTGTQANLNTQILRRLEVPVLPLDDQAKIVNRLDRIDEMSESVDGSLDSLKAMRSALLDSMLARGSHVH